MACDLGGTSFRAALIDSDGNTRADTTIMCPPAIEWLGRSEIDADDWWKIFVAAGGILASKEPALFSAIVAVAICGVTRSQVFLDSNGRLLRPAITWKDTRAQGFVGGLSNELCGGHPEFPNLNAFHPLARLAWLGEHEGAMFRELSSVLEPKDYLNFRLTGRSASDAVSMARLISSAQVSGGVDLFSAIGASARLIPPILNPCDQVGVITTELPAPLDQLVGVPVFCCCNDTWTAVVGLGARRQGYAYNISGTTEVLGVMSSEAVEAEGLLTVDWLDLYQLGGPSLNGADTVTWLLGILGRDSTSAGSSLEALLGGRRHPEPLLFLPYLQGERVPYWDPTLRGSFVGLNRQHGPTDLAWAVLEGIAFLNRIVLEAAEAALGWTVSEIRFGGGAAASPAWRQIKADVCGRPIVVGASHQPGTLGAAMVAWTGLKHFQSLEEAQDKLVKIEARHEPEPSRRAIYQQMYDLFRRSELALAPISRDLVALSGQTGSLPGLHACPPSRSKGSSD